MVDEVFDWHAASCNFISSVIISPSCTILELRHVDADICTGAASMSSNRSGMTANTGGRTVAFFGEAHYFRK
jgi:hypothetical protein